MTANTKHCHSIYMAELTKSSDEKNFPARHTLILLNVPPYITATALSSFFGKLGQIVSVSFEMYDQSDLEVRDNKSKTEFFNHQQPYKFKKAYIVYKYESSVVKALIIKSIDLFHENGNETIVQTGVSLWYDKHLSKIILGDKTMVRAQQILEKYQKDKEEEERLEKEKAKCNEDGWITVTRRGRNAGFEQNKDRLDNLRKRMKANSGEVKDFYAHQHKENKKNELLALRKTYLEEKKRILLGKSSRVFQPK